MGTLPLIYAAPTSFGTIILGKIIGNTILSMSSLLISYMTAKLMTRERVHIESPGYLVLSLILAVIGFSVVALCIAYLMMISRKTRLYMNLLEIPIIMLCGLAYPIEVLPQWAQAIAKLIPLTWIVKLIRMSITGVVSRAEYYRMFGISLASIVICMLAAIWFYRLIDRMIRKNATLEGC